MAELDEPTDENISENRRQNNTFFFVLKKLTSRSMVSHIIRVKILLIFNIILTDGIRMFLNTLTKKIEANCKITFVCSEIINALFDGLAYATCKISARIIC